MWPAVCVFINPAPDACWLVFVCVIYALLFEANAVFRELQDVKTLLSEQRERDIPRRVAVQYGLVEELLQCLINRLIGRA